VLSSKDRPILGGGAKRSDEVMNLPSMPRILGPNLGCPEILTLQQLRDPGFEILVAVAASAGQPGPDWSLRAVPSFAGEGVPFELELKGPDGASAPQEVADDGLPQVLGRVEETRRLTSTTLRSEIFEGKARFWVFSAKSKEPLADRHFRGTTTEKKPLPTLYDLELRTPNKECVHRVLHALCLRGDGKPVRFVHLTDLHLAERNDLWKDEVDGVPPANAAQVKPFNNFNENMRGFICWANAQAEKGKLDFVLALGDLVDFVEQGITKPAPAPNNWRVFIDILTGAGNERTRKTPNQGLKVPVFTTTGNHDWRANPYPPEVHAKIFELSRSRAAELDYVYRDSPEAVGKRIEQVHKDLVKNGSPILASSWWHTCASFGLRGILVLADRITSRLVTLAQSFARYVFAALAALIPVVLRHQVYSPSAASHIKVLILGSLSLVAIGIALLLDRWFLGEWLGTKVRQLVEGLIAIEESLPGLGDYFLEINPYFNYAFRLGTCHFLVLDTGHDCLTAQSFWDQGGKKLGRLSLEDNILGGSPDTMGFYPPGPHFPYSQIAWLERVLECIKRVTGNQEARGSSPYRVFVGLHSPAANLSEKQRAKAEREVKGRPEILLKKGLFGYDVCYGTVNHYLSQFYRLCLGFREESGTECGCGVDVVLAGHAHWRLEFRLKKPAGQGKWNPEVHYGTLTGGGKKWMPDGTLLLQTAAAGPPCWLKVKPEFAKPPYCRLISVDEKGYVTSLQHGRIEAADRELVGD